MGEFRYIWTTEKYVCPSCGETTYQRFIDVVTGELLNEKYGKCDRINNCCYNERPETLFVNEDEEKAVIVAVNNHDLYDLDKDVCTILEKEQQINISYNEANPSKFFKTLFQMFGTENVLRAVKEYRLGCVRISNNENINNNISFPYYFKGNLINAKIIFYAENLHRNKLIDISWLNFMLKSYQFSPLADVVYKYTLPLFGWDLLDKPENKTKKVCIVEAEKSAFICSILMPEYVWLATGQKQLLKPYKLPYNSHRDFYLFADMDGTKDGKEYFEYWQEQAQVIAENCKPFNHTIVDYMPASLTTDQQEAALSKGYDIADFILDADKLGYDFNKYVQQVKNIIDA